MQLTVQQVQHVATLARLLLTPQEEAKFAVEMSSILEYVGKLNEVDTTDIKPTSQVTGLTNVLRNDKVISSNDKESLAKPEDILACSSHPVERNQIKVKSVFT